MFYWHSIHIRPTYNDSIRCKATTSLLDGYHVSIWTNRTVLETSVDVNRSRHVRHMARTINSLLLLAYILHTYVCIWVQNTRCVEAMNALSIKVLILVWWAYRKLSGRASFCWSSADLLIFLSARLMGLCVVRHTNMAGPPFGLCEPSLSGHVLVNYWAKEIIIKALVCRLDSSGYETTPLARRDVSVDARKIFSARFSVIRNSDDRRSSL